MNLIDRKNYQNDGDEEFTKPLRRLTGILLGPLYSPKNLEIHSIAMKMNWAADGITTRVEDIAYSLCLVSLESICHCFMVKVPEL